MCRCPLLLKGYPLSWTGACCPLEANLAVQSLALSTRKAGARDPGRKVGRLGDILLLGEMCLYKGRPPTVVAAVVSGHHLKDAISF